LIVGLGAAVIAMTFRPASTLQHAAQPRAPSKFAT